MLLILQASSTLITIYGVPVMAHQQQDIHFPLVTGACHHMHQQKSQVRRPPGAENSLVSEYIHEKEQQYYRTPRTIATVCTSPNDPVEKLKPRASATYRALL